MTTFKDLDGCTVIALRKEYIRSEGPGEDSFDMDPCTDIKYTMLLKKNDRMGDKFVITLQQSYGWCGSGYTTSSYVFSSIEYLYSNFGPFTHIPSKPGLAFHVESEKIGTADYESIEIKTNYFSIWDNNDSYYPYAYLEFNEELFTKLPRAFDERPVWIFRGPSALGKSTLAMNFKDYTVYETDVSPELPEVIYDDVIVVGGKYKFDIDDIKKRVFDTKNIILVDFSR